MLQVRATSHQRQLDIGQGCADQHAQVLALPQMRHDQPLPVAVQHVLAHRGRNLYAAARRARLQPDMCLGIMP